MSWSQTAQSRSKSTPISGLIACLSGMGVLALYAKGYRIYESGADLLQFAAGMTCLLWGLRTVFFSNRSGPENNARWSRWIPYRVALTREGLMYIVIMITVFIGAMLGRSNLLLLVFGLLAGPFVINGYVTLTMLKRNTLQRLSPARVMAGEPFLVELELANRRRWISSWVLVVQDRLQNSRELLQPRILFTRVSPGTQRVGRYQARLLQRGRYQFGPLRLSTRFPLGLVDRSLTLDSPGEVLVHPRIGRLSNAWRREQFQADELVHHARTRHGAFDDEFHRLREYRAGDNPRAIHWRTSARRNSLMVREYHQNRDQDLAVLVDFWGAAGGSESERLELAMSFAATLCVEHCRRSRESSIFLGISGDQTRRWQGPAGPLSINPLLDHLALALPGPAQEIDRLALESFHLRSPHVRRVLITTRPADSAGKAASQALQAEARRHGFPLRIIEASAGGLAPFFEWDW
jgi:uncharacterized protein (DUF58 family)